MANEGNEIDETALEKNRQSERLVIKLDDLPPEDFTLQTRTYPGMSHAAEVVSPGEKTGMTSLGGSAIKQNALAGLIGGAMAWGLAELVLENNHLGTGEEILISMAIWGACIGAAMGSVLGCADGITGKVNEKAVTGGAIGGAVGLIGGSIGGFSGQLLYSVLGGGSNAALGAQILARTFGWGILGMFIGIAQGVPGKTTKKVVNGLIGGLIGGTIGGLAFDFLCGAANTDVIGRMFAITALGAVTGVSIGMVEEARKEAWLKVIEGPLSGKQFIVYDTITRIGSSPKCEIVLIKDPNVQAEHCRIVCKTNVYYIECPQGVTIPINGLSTNNGRLKSGDVISVGRSKLVYEDKAAATLGGFLR